MPNGKPGDHPYTDIMHELRRVYSSRIDDLVREVVQLSDEHERRELAKMLMGEYNDLEHPDLAKLERALLQMRDRLRHDTTRDSGES